MLRFLLTFSLAVFVGHSLFAEESPSVLNCTGPTGADAKTVVSAQRAWAKYLGEARHEKVFPLDTAGKVNVAMVLIPPGKYYRGEGNKAVLVTLSQPLWVSKYEVTQQQYAALMGNNPSHFPREGEDAASCPVEAVSHRQAVKFCETASVNTGGEFCLLTEAEWEYACRAGTRTKYYNGDSDDDVGQIAQYKGNNLRHTEKVGTKAPNAFGLYDMAGNVWEWCADFWTPSYDMSTTIDPIGPETGQGCVTRGGSWSSDVNNCRAAHRTRDAETYAGAHLGFRLARIPSSPLISRQSPPPLDCTKPTGADAKTVLAAQRAWAKHLGVASHEKPFPLDKERKVTARMVLLPPGKYYRGNEKNPTIITLTKPLWVGKYELTQQQYAAVMGNNPSHFKREGAGALYPVEMVSHQSAVKFCKTASKNTGAEFRLLWQAEWEYAYRAGTQTRYYNGDSDEGVFEIAQCTENNFTSTAKVGSKLPNAFAIYDMAGNVTEWCADRWRRDFAETQTTDPRGPKTGTIYVHRGNAWDSYGRTCNATSRGLASETYGGIQLGVRPV